MKYTIQELRAHYTQNTKFKATIIDEVEVVCTHLNAKGRTTITFMTETLDREKFKELLAKMKSHGASTMTVYCETATYISDTARITLNR